MLYTMTTATARPDLETRVNDARRAYVAAGDAADAIFCAVIQAAPDVCAADAALDNAEKILSLAKDALHIAEQERRAAFAARDAARAAALDASPEYIAATAAHQAALSALESAKRALFRSRN